MTDNQSKEDVLIQSIIGKKAEYQIMLPSIERALEELKLAGELNPGPWIKHSENVGLAARNIAGKVPGMDADKAYVLGVLHDIGRRV